MRKLLGFGSVFTLALVMVWGTVYAQEKDVEDITKETIVGPGSISVATDKDLLMSFGATVRVIPTAENDWDFGFSEGTGNAQFETHSNESGAVNDGYIRNELKLHFNAMPKDRKWSFYTALEFDRPWETSSVDSRGGKSNDNSNFGLERLHGTMALPANLRFHAGFDIWHLDVIEGAGMVYGDDNPGFWLTGDFKSIDVNVGYFKLGENDFQNSSAAFSDAGPVDDDRDLFAGHLTWELSEENKFKFFYAYDRIESVPAGDAFGVTDAFGVGATPETDSHHLGGYWIGNYGGLEAFIEGVYQFGEAKDTGLSALPWNTNETFDIAAYGVALDLSYDFEQKLGYQLKPRIGFMYTSGDEDETDDTLGGYNGVENAQRFSQRWGGENTIIGDTNPLMGTALYGYLPEFYGNGTAVFTGGLQNFAGTGSGRGDNPGLSMISVGLTFAPKIFLIYKTNVNYFSFNEDFWIGPSSAALGGTEIKAGHAGTEWDNELTLAMSKHSFIKLQASWLFPGEVIEDVTEALGNKSTDTATRFATEFIWNF